MNRFSSRSFWKLFIIALVTLNLFASGGNAAEWVRRDEFCVALLEARGFPVKGLEKPAEAYKKAVDQDLVPVLGRPDGFLTRREMLRFAIQSLHLNVEANLLQSSPLPFKDIAHLSRFEHGCLAVALSLEPKLIHSEKKFNPDRKVSSGEAKFWLQAIESASKGMVLHVVLEEEKGLSFIVHRENALDRFVQWRTVMDGFETREAAVSVADSLRSGKHTVFVDNANYEWRIRSDLFDEKPKAQRLAALGRKMGANVRVLPYLPIVEATGGPRFWIALVLDPSRFVLEPLISPNGVSTLAPLSAMTDSGVRGAVNGGFFTKSAQDKGFPIGTLMTRKRLINSPYQGRTCLGWSRMNTAAFGMVEWEGVLQHPELGEQRISSINRMSKADSICLFTPEYGESTPATSRPMLELLIRKGRCVERRNTPGPVPDGAFVLAGYGGGVETLAGVNVGDAVVIRQAINAGDPDWNRCDSIIQAGPFILRNGDIQRDNENLSVGITERRHPRTVIGLTDKGRWMLWVGDGRNPIHSIGFTLDEAARLLRDYGVVYALNLDGGGSSEMIYRNRIVNLPSEGKERVVSYGVGVRSRLSK